VSFESIDAEGAHPELLRGVYESNLYDITFENVSIMLQEFYGLEKDDAFSRRNFSLVLSVSNSPLASYINENMADYVTEVLKHCGDGIADDERASLKLLNSDIPLEMKQDYISVLKTRLSSFVDINDKNLWISLLKNDSAILYSEENVIEYCCYTEWEFDDALATWACRQTVPLDFSDDKLFGDDEDLRFNFLNAVVLCDVLGTERYSEFTASIGRAYEKFSFDGIKEEKMKILISNGVIILNSETLAFLRENYRFGIICDFIVQNIREYNGLLEQDISLLDKKELDYILSINSKVPEEQQMRALRVESGELSVNNKSYTEKVVVHILANNFLESDYEYLVRSYDSFSDGVKNSIGGLFIERISQTIESRMPITKAFFDDLYSAGRLDQTICKKILALALPSIGVNDATHYLNKHGLGAFTDVFDMSKRPQFENTELNEYVLDRFVHWGKIKEHNLREDGRIHIKR